MAEAIQIEFPESDRRVMFAQLERARKELGKSLGQAVRFAAWSVATSLGASTKVSKKVRNVRMVRVNRKDWGAVREYKEGRKVFEVEDWRWGSPPKHFKVTASSLGEAKKKNRARIRKYGLAKSSWMWGVRALGAGAKFGGLGPIARSKARDAISVTKKLSGLDPFIEIRNKLGYIRSALEGGPAEINTAMGRAARHMAHVIDANIKKKMGAK